MKQDHFDGIAEDMDKIMTQTPTQQAEELAWYKTEYLALKTVINLALDELKLVLPNQTNIDLRTGIRHLSTELSALRQQNEELKKDKDTLDWLESNLDRYCIECDLAAISPFWITKRFGSKQITIAQGKNLRQVINSARKAQTK